MYSKLNAVWLLTEALINFYRGDDSNGEGDGNNEDSPCFDNVAAIADGKF